MTRRNRFILLGALIVAPFAFFGEYEGPVRAIAPDLQIRVRDSGPLWMGPHVMAKMDEPNAVYLIVPDASEDERRQAVKVSIATGEQSRTIVRLGPAYGLRDCLPNPSLRAAIHGLRFERPAFHLLVFPGGGAGLHWTDSATGRLDIVFGDGDRARRLLSQHVYNADGINVLLDSVCVDPGGHWIARPSQDADGWLVTIFRL